MWSPFSACDYAGIFDANTHFTEPKQPQTNKSSTSGGNNALNVPKMLRKCAKSKRLLDAMENGVFDALERGYLRTVALVISHPDDPKTLLEEYLFTVEYDEAKRARVLTSGGGAKDKERVLSADAATGKKRDEERLTDPKRIRKNAIATTRTLLSLVRTLDALPDGSAANLNLTYTEETPATYEPPFFEAADDAAVDDEDGDCLSMKEEYHDGSKTWKRDPFTMELGKIETLYHAMKVKASSALDPLLDEEEEEEEEEEEVVIEEQIGVVQKPTVLTVEKEKPRRQSTRYPDRDAMRIHGGVDPNANVVPETQLVGALTMVHPPPVEKKKRGRPPKRARPAEPVQRKKRGRPAKVSEDLSQPPKQKKAKVVAKKEKEKKKRKVATVATVTDDSALASLKEFIETMGGHLPANWSAKVASRERTDKGRISLHTDVTYIDPNGKRYRSKLEVARCLNLLVQ